MTARQGASTPDNDLDLFGFRSRTVGLALAGFGVAYLIVEIGMGWTIRSPIAWTGIAVAFGVFVAATQLVATRVGDPIPLSAALVGVGATLAGVVIAWWSLPQETYRTLQSGPPAAAAIVVLTLVALRGRPLLAWAGLLAVSLTAGIWAVGFGLSFGNGVVITVWTYPMMVMATLFVIILRPMARRVVMLRRRSMDDAATAAAAAAAADERRTHFRDFERRARPTLERVVDGHEFTPEEVRIARLLEAQLRDGIRAPGWDSPEIRAAVWSARSRGTEVALLDDGDPTAVGADGAVVPASLTGPHADLIALLGDDARAVTARILPPGRDTHASIVVQMSGHSRRIDYDVNGREVVDRDVEDMPKA
ncbi:hypothetical protein [Gordonia soli]|uniref:Uncharacterized protein n=1 Tax=Gordonia soli NBRC 108243 TaxID=1223545 RepID=M0QHE6_9ACTN|nr:hypothetical protein [Gordonia soli]GAC67736.1 hypothetical protein GS4_11_00040 [Gordonia soli NBRC 108243]